MKKAIIKVYDNYKECGIINRKMTEGEEKNLVDSFVNDFMKQKRNKTEHYVIFVETKVGDSYPDIIFVKYNPKNYKKWNKKRNNLNIQDIKILCFLFNSDYSSILKVSESLGISKSKAEKSISKLVESGLVIGRKKGYKIKNKKVLSSIKIRSIEAKMNKWDNVLNQSILNKNFSDECYVLVKSKYTPNLNIINQYKENDVGIYFSNSTSIEIKNRPIIRNKSVNHYKLLFNEWVGRILNSSESLNAN